MPSAVIFAAAFIDSDLASQLHSTSAAEPFDQELPSNRSLPSKIPECMGMTRHTGIVKVDLDSLHYLGPQEYCTAESSP